MSGLSDTILSGSWQRQDVPLITRPKWSLFCSSQNVLHDLAINVGEAEVTALEAVGELFVIEPEQVHDGGLKVMDVNFIARN